MQERSIDFTINIFLDAKGRTQVDDILDSDYSDEQDKALATQARRITKKLYLTRPTRDSESSPKQKYSSIEIVYSDSGRENRSIIGDPPEVAVFNELGAKEYLHQHNLCVYHTKTGQREKLITLLRNDQLGEGERSSFSEKLAAIEAEIKQVSAWLVEMEYEDDIIPVIEQPARGKGAAPAETKPRLQQPEPAARQMKDAGFNHSPDYSSVKIRGSTFNLTPPQAKVIELLHQEYSERGPEGRLSQKYILDEVMKSTKTYPTRVREIFSTNRAAYRELVEYIGIPRGHYRLKR